MTGLIVSTNHRWILWLVLLSLTVIAAIFPTDESGPNKMHQRVPRRNITSNMQATMQATAAKSLLLPVNTLPELAHDPFDPVGWDLPPPPPPAPPAVIQPPTEPPALIEPPMPYQYMGRLKMDDGSTEIYLAKGQESVVAHVGDNLDTNYKLLSMDDNKLIIAYLPMNHLHDIAMDKH